MIDASRTDNADDEHDPEGSTIAFERAQLSALRAAAEHDLADIELALLAYAQARYGICQVCGEQIAAARLELRPASSTCVRCAGVKPARRGGQ
jgi:DnaK suppressor protein